MRNCCRYLLSFNVVPRAFAHLIPRSCVACLQVLQTKADENLQLCCLRVFEMTLSVMPFGLLNTASGT
ncbi:hypothetical protein UC8_55980 [Roseimaritima ulvae]|uniref:Secreted protein n=1 Tax=Roseimaritima ulvae TaxID=980254 RepID=A0A5B9QWZ7_9BACT|nr:hypothetical protein UC8_55980 [Roseimaritima ulvae]